MSSLYLPWCNLRPFPLYITSYTRRDQTPPQHNLPSGIVVERNKVSPEPPLLQTKQSQLPQLLLKRPVLQIPHQLHCPSLDSLQCLDVFLVVRGPKLNTVLRTQAVASPDVSRGGTITSLVLLATLFLIQARMSLVFLATWAHCWLMFS